VRLRVDRLAETRPISASTRSASSKLVGSTTLAITRSRNTSSPSASDPRSAYTPASTSYSRPDAVFSVRARGTTGRGPGAAPPPNNAGCPGAGTIAARLACGAIPRSSTPCRSSWSRHRASSMSSPSSASQRAEPTCRTILRRPATDSAICTAVDPDAVRTRRTQATSRVYEPD
jgi:hypothetical protein